ncbi:DUF7144 family membrane protein [Streptacidiphilus griseoplanus]|uniref:DUF7144 family membrane protein n=1 Tax=Peterkaempfera griseoplana TaxID=66896 RepID=UPI000A68446F|nr:hypothetical protein [Peterkaempfera griseoplana]
MAAPPDGTQQRPASPDDGWVTGPYLFGGLALELSGTLSILMGAAGIAQSTIFANSRYPYGFNLTAWGWIHVVIGIGLLAAGLGVLAGRSWGRGAGIALGAVSLVTQFMFVPYYPLWSISLMVLDLVAVWTLSRFSQSTSSGIR